MLKYLIQTFIFRCSKNYGSLTHETRIKDAVNMGDLICLLATVRTLKASRMGHSVKASLWCDSLLINTRFRFILEWAIIVKRIWCYFKTKSFQTTQEGYKVIIILPIKSKMAAAKKQCFLRFLYWTESSPWSPTVIQSLRFTNDYKFGISVNTYQ